MRNRTTADVITDSLPLLEYYTGIKADAAEVRNALTNPPSAETPTQDSGDNAKRGELTKNIMQHIDALAESHGDGIYEYFWLLLKEIKEAD